MLDIIDSMQQQHREDEEKNTRSTSRTPCKGCRISYAKMSSGYCLSCDREYNHGGSHIKQSLKQREEREEDMNMDACYKCQKDNGGECMLYRSVFVHMILY